MSESLGTIHNPVIMQQDTLFTFEGTNMPSTRYQDIVNMKCQAQRNDDLSRENYQLRMSEIKKDKIIDGLLLAVGKYV